jgi:hypothetical protein
MSSTLFTKLYPHRPPITTWLDRVCALANRFDGCLGNNVERPRERSGTNHNHLDLVSQSRAVHRLWQCLIREVCKFWSVDGVMPTRYTQLSELPLARMDYVSPSLRPVPAIATDVQIACLARPNWPLRSSLADQMSHSTHSTCRIPTRQTQVKRHVSV